MKRLWRKGIVILMSIALVFTLAGCGNTTPAEKGTDQQGTAPEKIELKIRSGATSGTWYPATGAIAKFLPEAIPGLSATVTPGAGISNVLAIQNGTADFAFGKAAATYQGMQGVDPFEEKTDKIRNIGYLYDEAFHIAVLADSGINSIADLKGKSVTTQTTGNLAEQMLRDVLEVYGLSYNDMKKVTQVGYDDSVQQMKDGIVEAFAFATATPASVLMDLSSARKIKLLPIDADKLKELQQKNAGYITRPIKAGTYDFQKEEVLSFGSAVHMMVSSDMSEDFAYQITKAIVENREKIGEVHKTYEGLTPEIMSAEIGIPFHPGAIKYYKEIGVMK